MNSIMLLSWLILLLLLFFFFLFLLRSTWTTFSYYFLTPLHIRKAMLKQGVSGPAPHFLTGNLHEIASLIAKSTSSDMPAIDHDIVGRLMPHYLLWSKTYGKRFMYWYGTEPRFCLTETDTIKDFLSSKYVQVSGKSWLQQQGSKHFLGQGVLMANGQKWLHQRHVVGPEFMGDRLKGHLWYMVECTKKMVSILHDTISSSGSNEVEIGEYMTRLTADIIARTEFNSSYEKGKKIFDLLTRMQSSTAKASRYLWIPGSRYFPSKFKNEVKSLKKEVEKMLMEIIDCRRHGVKIGRVSSYGRDLLGMLLLETQKKKGEGLSYTLQMVMDECKTFFFTGHDTTALLLTWTIMLLATNPEWQEKARAEVVEVGGEDPSVDHISKLNLLHMIINESLRLYPPASLLPRMVFDDIKLGDLHIPKGLSIWIPVLAIHHDKKIWGNDANEFNPERFATRSFSLTRHFLPFASGPRNCVGQAYAMMEAKITLAHLLYNFRFRISKNYRHAPVNVLTLKPKHGVQVHLEPLRL